VPISTPPDPGKAAVAGIVTPFFMIAGIIYGYVTVDGMALTTSRLASRAKRNGRTDLDSILQV
jgi:hypothetical protein